MKKYRNAGITRLILKKITDLSRRSKIGIQVATDILVAFTCFPFALLLAGQSPNTVADPKIFVALFFSITILVMASTGFGLYQSLVRFITGKTLLIITKSILAASCSLILLIVIGVIKLPLAVPIIFSMVLFLAIGGIRFVIRQIFRNQNQTLKRSAVIYGAGKAGRELQNMLLYNNEIQPVAFIDDNIEIQGLSIGGCQVYSISSYFKIGSKADISLVLLALPSISQKRRREIVELFRKYDFEIKSIPPMSQILIGQASMSDLIPVTPDMLLGRDPVAPIQSLMQRNISGKSVMVTGAGGSIGTELCKQILEQQPSKLILFELSEFALYKINEKFSKLSNSTLIVPVLGSVCDANRVEHIISTFNIDSIYHAAAYKHVPIIEDNIIEGIKNNIFGTLNMVEKAKKHNVRNFILISSDKAVRPTNVMGASKRFAELICQAYASEVKTTRYSMVRFGNVLGSSGSVIPMFQKQIEAGGPVTVTHPEITRYFMTIREAAQLVIQAGALSNGGEVFVLDMGKPVIISKLAEEMIKLAGLKPYIQDGSAPVSSEPGHIAICFTGLRKGEKLYEELLVSNRSERTEHSRIMKATELFIPLNKILNKIKQLDEACKENNVESALNILKELPLGYHPTIK